jgi:hypothetical protein
VKKVNKNVKKAKPTKKEKSKFMETRIRSDNSKEIIIKKSPMETIWGKILLGVILIGFVLLPVVSLVWLIIEAVSR